MTFSYHSPLNLAGWNVSPICDIMYRALYNQSSAQLWSKGCKVVLKESWYYFEFLFYFQYAKHVSPQDVTHPWEKSLSTVTHASHRVGAAEILDLWRKNSCWNHKKWVRRSERSRSLSSPLSLRSRFLVVLPSKNRPRRSVSQFAEFVVSP